jgi:hypothetical protein
MAAASPVIVAEFGEVGIDHHLRIGETGFLGPETTAQNRIQANCPRSICIGETGFLRPETKRSKTHSGQIR